MPWMFHCTDPAFTTAPFASFNPLLNFTSVPVDMSNGLPPLALIVTVSSVPLCTFNVVPSPLDSTVFFNIPIEVSADSPPVLNSPPPPMSSAPPPRSSVPSRFSVVPTLRVSRPVAISAVVNVLPSTSVPACRLMFPGLVHALVLLIVVVPPFTTRLPALSKEPAGVMFTAPALALTVPPAPLLKVVEANVSVVPLALITPLLTTVAVFELLKLIEPVALSVIPCPIV